MEITSRELAIFKNRPQDVREGCRRGHSGQEHVNIQSSRKRTCIGALQTCEPEKVQLLQVEDLSAVASPVPFHWSKTGLRDERHLLVDFENRMFTNLQKSVRALFRRGNFNAKFTSQTQQWYEHVIKRQNLCDNTICFQSLGYWPCMGIYFRSFCRKVDKKDEDRNKSIIDNEDQNHLSYLTQIENFLTQRTILRSTTHFLPFSS